MRSGRASAVFAPWVTRSQWRCLATTPHSTLAAGRHTALYSPAGASAGVRPDCRGVQPLRPRHTACCDTRGGGGESVQTQHAVSSADTRGPGARAHTYRSTCRGLRGCSECGWTSQETTQGSPSTGPPSGTPPPEQPWESRQLTAEEPRGAHRCKTVSPCASLHVAAAHCGAWSLPDCQGEQSNRPSSASHSGSVRSGMGGGGADSGVA